MANYNLTTTNSSVYSITETKVAANGAVTLLTNGVDNSVIRINSLIVCNDSSSVLTNCQVSLSNGLYIAYNLTVPAKSNVSIISRDTSIYLQYNESISGSSQGNYNFQNGTTFIISYDRIS
jgi:hypothetical protein